MDRQTHSLPYLKSVPTSRPSLSCHSEAVARVAAKSRVKRVARATSLSAAGVPGTRRLHACWGGAAEESLRQNNGPTQSLIASLISLESHPCIKIRDNSHRITSLHKNLGGTVGAKHFQDHSMAPCPLCLSDSVTSVLKRFSLSHFQSPARKTSANTTSSAPSEVTHIVIYNSITMNTCRKMGEGVPRMSQQISIAKSGGPA